MIWILWCLGALAGSESLPVRVLLLERVVVGHSPVVLRDVADIHGPSEVVAALELLDLGAAPGPGYRKVVTAAGVALTARVHGFSLSADRIAGASQTLVTGHYAALEGRDLVTAARRFALDQLSSPEQRVLLEPGSSPAAVSLLTELGPHQLEIGFASHTEGTNTLQLRVSVYQGDQHRADRLVTLKIRRFGAVLRLLGEVRRGQQVPPSQVLRVETDITKLRGPRIQQADQLQGLVARRALSAGQIVLAQDMERPILVKRGDPVQAILRSGGLEILLHSVAASSGRQGDHIEVINPDSSKRLVVELLGKKGNVGVVARVL
jgi:flagella basal body P-ring formation protein FlgA